MAHADRVARISVLLALLLAGSSAGATENYRSVVIFGDTQRLVTDGQFGGRFYFERMVEWVMDETNREAENIDFVLHVGDVIQSAIPCNALEPDEQSMASCEGNMPAIQTQWATFDEIWAPISDSDLPFAIVRGCHDNANTFPGFVGSFDQNYGREKFEGFSSQWSNAEVLATCDGETLPENDPQGVCPATNDTGHVWKFRLGGPFPQDVLVAGMPDKPSYELQAWYRFILEREAGIPSILLNHASLSRNQGSAFRNLVEGPFSTWGPLVDRVFMTAMGHLSYDIKDIIDIDGFQVLRVLFDRQGENLPAGAGIALIRFYIDANGIHRVEGKTIEPNIFGVPGFVASGDFGPVPFAVDGDIDNDGLIDAQDNCDVVVNPAQADLDADGVGDDCESDIDGDLIPDSVDPDLEVVLNCEIEEQAMTVPNYCDGDLVAPIGVVDSADQAALLACLDLGNAPGCAKADMNEDGSWDGTDYVIFERICAGACVDLDADGVPDDVDNCVSIE
ncbi:MAG: thrombospondin type 3 repeat-containing protein, partial [Myxococcota bacterium]